MIIYRLGGKDEKAASSKTHVYKRVQDGCGAIGSK
jgi:hypothetical protein